MVEKIVGLASILQPKKSPALTIATCMKVLKYLTTRGPPLSPRQTAPLSSNFVTQTTLFGNVLCHLELQVLWGTILACIYVICFVLRYHLIYTCNCWSTSELLIERLNLPQPVTNIFFTERSLCICPGEGRQIGIIVPVRLTTLSRVINAISLLPIFPSSILLLYRGLMSTLETV